MEENSSGKALDNEEAAAKKLAELKHQGWPHTKAKEAFCPHHPIPQSGAAGHQEESSQEGHHVGRRRAEGPQQASPLWMSAAFGARVSRSSMMLTLADGTACSAPSSGSTPRGWRRC